MKQCMYSFVVLIEKKTPIIEEGLAVYYSFLKPSFEYKQRLFRSSVFDEEYKCSYMMFKKLNDLCFSIKKAREKYSKMSEWTSEFLIEEIVRQNINLSENINNLLNDLTKKFYKIDKNEWKKIV